MNHWQIAQQRAMEARRALVVELTCQVCDQPFTTTGDRVNARMCSDACRRERDRRGRLEWKRNNRARHLENKRRYEQTAHGRERKRARARAHARRLRAAGIVQVKPARLCQCGATLEKSRRLCDTCRAARVEARREARRSEQGRRAARDRQRKRYADNPEKGKEKARRYRRAYPDRKRAQSIAWMREHPEQWQGIQRRAKDRRLRRSWWERYGEISPLMLEFLEERRQLIVDLQLEAARVKAQAGGTPTS